MGQFKKKGEASQPIPRYFKFKDVVDPGDERCAMVLIEDRGDEVLVQELAVGQNMLLKSQDQYPRNALVEISESQADTMVIAEKKLQGVL